MKRKKFFTVIAVVVAISLVGASIAYASTSTATSNSSTTPVINGYTYTYYSTLTIYSSSGANASVSADASSNVPAGYIGVSPRLYKDAVLYMSGSWRYNSIACAGVTSAVDNSNVSGIYYSCGQVEFYNGSTYTPYTSYASPKLNYTVSASSSLISNNSLSDNEFINLLSNISGSLLKSDISIDLNNDYIVKENKNGETYGSGLSVDITGKRPDLISAYGIDGTFGYVRSDDLNADEISKPSEYLLQDNSERLIPLYDKDGENIIGKFQIQSTILITN